MSKSLRPKSLKPKSLKPKSLKPKSLARPKSLEKNDEQQDDPVATAILAAIAAAGGTTVAPREVAQALAAQHPKPRDRPDAWRRYLTAVRQQALHLARAGRIQIVRRGQPVAPHQVKGVIRLGPPAI